MDFTPILFKGKCCKTGAPDYFVAEEQGKILPNYSFLQSQNTQKMSRHLPLLVVVGMMLNCCAAQAQASSDLFRKYALPPALSLEPADSFHKSRLIMGATVGATIYGVAAVGLWKAWYKDNELTRFHTFNDWGEWRFVDKAGHWFSAYLECNYAHQVATWTGMSPGAARWTALGIGMGIQTTIEVMDGYSAKWGFSWSDMAFNGLGAGFFLVQDLAWQEQRILMKVSGTRPQYSDEPIYDISHSQMTSLRERARHLFGSSPFETFIKDYNAMTIWASVNLSSFATKSRKNGVPPWLNIAVGYGAENIFGGFENQWTTNEGTTFSLDQQTFPRYTQFFLSPDVDLSRIPTNKRWLKLILGALNWIKIPAPGLEVNTLRQIKWHWWMW